MPETEPIPQPQEALPGEVIVEEAREISTEARIILNQMVSVVEGLIPKMAFDPSGGIGGMHELEEKLVGIETQIKSLEAEEAIPAVQALLATRKFMDESKKYEDFEDRDARVRAAAGELVEKIRP